MSEAGHATLHLRVLGESRKVSVAVPPTPAGMGDLLAAARSIANTAIGVAIEKSAAAGAPVTCCKGCSVCCDQLVPVTAPEARALGRLVDAMPAERQAVIRERFAQTLAAVRAAGIMEAASPAQSPVWILHGDKQGRDRYFDVAERYFRLHRPCAFLEDGACSIYEDRPLVCREYVVTSPAKHCAKLEHAFINMVEPPVRLSDGVAEITSLVEGKPAEQLPLFGALAWAALPENAGPERNVSGVELLKLLARWVDSKSGVPLEERGKG